MIKKSIASILIILILINSIGCYSYSQINKESAVIFKEDDTVKIMTIDEKVYELIDVKIDGSEVKGVVVSTHSEWLRDNQSKEVTILFEDIKKIEVPQFNVGLTLGLIIPCAGIVGFVIFYAIGMSNLK